MSTIYGAPIIARMINTVDITTSSIGCRSRRRDDNYNSCDENDYCRTTDFRALYLYLYIILSLRSGVSMADKPGKNNDKRVFRLFKILKQPPFTGKVL